jgi:hypothetical protein
VCFSKNSPRLALDWLAFSRLVKRIKNGRDCTTRPATQQPLEITVHHELEVLLAEMVVVLSFYSAASAI